MGRKNDKKKSVLLVSRDHTADLDRGNEPCDFGPERFKNGRINRRRAKALERNARFVYEYDRD